MNRSLESPATAAITDARMLRSREALRNALLELLQRKPLGQITIREIAAQAQVGYATFFRHHPTKESLLNDLAAELLNGLVAMTLPALNAADTHTTCVRLCAYVDERRALWSALLTGGAAGVLREQFIRAAHNASTHIEAYDWLPVELGLVHASSAIIEMLAWWLRQTDPMPVERIADIMNRLVVGPLVNRQTK